MYNFYSSVYFMNNLSGNPLSPPYVQFIEGKNEKTGLNELGKI